MTVSPTTDSRPAEPSASLGALRTDRGNLPLHAVDIRATVTGLAAAVDVVQGFRNPYDVPLEATYVFPLPDRAAVTAMRLTAAGREVEADLRERAAARREYEEAIAAGQRAAIAEEERPDVFTLRVGNIAPGEDVSVRLSLATPLPYADGAAELRLPLVVAPRYVPGTPLDAPAAGAGYAEDTDAVPDASRISPPILLPGVPNPVALSLTVELDEAAARADQSCNLPVDAGDGRLTLRPGRRLNTDFVLRLGYPAATKRLDVVPEGEDGGTFELTVLPPADAGPRRPRAVVLVLDRSGSMGGWKMVAARRAAARIVDTLTADDRFAVLTFDDVVERPDLPPGLLPATDRHRYRAVEHLARADARGGTEMLAPLREAVDLLGDAPGDRVLVLVTDGQVANEDQILGRLGDRLRGVRVHTVGIDTAVNAGFLNRLAVLGGGRCEVVESEDRLDDAMDHIHARIGAPLVTGVRLGGDLAVEADSVAPARLPGLFPGVPLVIRGRYAGAPAAVTLSGVTAAGERWEATAQPTIVPPGAVPVLWARARLRDLEDEYASRAGVDPSVLERRIVDLSLRYRALCRFTAWVAVDRRAVTDGGAPHRVVQPVELPAGWPPPVAAGPIMMQTFAASGAPPTQLRMMRAASRIGAPVPAGRRVDPIAEARTQLAEELSRLRRQPSTAAELADLGSRLTVLVDHLAARGAPRELLDRLRELAEALRGAEQPGTDTAGLAAYAIQVLEEVTTGTGPRPPRAFWKRT